MTQQIVVGLIVALVCLLAARRVVKAARGKSCCNCSSKDCQLRDRNKDKVKSKTIV